MIDEPILPGAGAPDARETQAAARLAEGKHLADALGRHDEAIAIFDEIALHFLDALHPALRECRAEALFWKSQSLFSLGDVEDALLVVDHLVEEHGDATELMERRAVCHALWVTVFTLRHEDLGEDDRILSICDDAIARFGGDTELWTRQRLLHFMIDKSLALAKLGRIEDGIALRNAVASRYRTDPDSALRAHAGRVIGAMNDRFSLDSADKPETNPR